MPSREKGEGSIYFNKQRKRWNAQYKEYDVNTGKMKKKTKSFKTEEEAKKYLSTIMYQKQNPLYIEHNGIPLCELMRANLKLKLDTNQITPTQFGRVSTTIEKIEKIPIGSKKIDEITTEEIQSFLNTLTDYSNSTIKKIYSEFNQIFNYAFSQNLILANPMADIIKPKSKIVNKPLKALTIEEQEYMAKYLMSLSLKKCRYKNVFLIQMFTGMRIGEVLALKITDIDLAHNIINVEHTISVDAEEKTIMKDIPKSFNGMREIPLTIYLKPYIIEQMNIAKINNHKENLLFVNRNGVYVDHRIANRILKKILINEFNIKDISTHSLRHTFGTRCAECDIKEVAIQRIMGHSSINATLDNYVDVSEKLKESELEKVYSYFKENMNIDYEDIVF